MKDRVVQYPNRFTLNQISGNTYDIVPAPGVVTEAGTDLNKANLLSDTTAAAIQAYSGVMLPADPKVNDALYAITQKSLIEVDLLETINITSVPASDAVTYRAAIGLVDYDFILVAVSGSITKAGTNYDSEIKLGKTSSGLAILTAQSLGTFSPSTKGILVSGFPGFSGGMNADRRYYFGNSAGFAFTLQGYASGDLGFIFLDGFNATYVSAINLSVKFYGIKVRGDI